MINKELILTHEYLKECFVYDKLTGKLLWRYRPFYHFKTDRAQDTCNTRFAGKEAGGLQKNSHSGKYYKAVGLKVNESSCNFMVHRVIWFYVTGEWPDQIDHVDGNGLNNKWDNLKNVSDEGNQRNKRLYACNKSGVSGVYARHGKWTAHIRVNSKLKHLGSFASIEDATAARRSAEERYGFHENHGKDRPL